MSNQPDLIRRLAEKIYHDAIEEPNEGYGVYPDDAINIIESILRREGVRILPKLEPGMRVFIAGNFPRGKDHYIGEVQCVSRGVVTFRSGSQEHCVCMLHDVMCVLPDAAEKDEVE